LAADESEEAAAQSRAWGQYVKKVRRGQGGTFDEQWARFEEIFRGRLTVDGPPPTWHPPLGAISNLDRFMKTLGVDGYLELHRWSVTERAAFWGKVTEDLGVVFSRPPDRILDLGRGVKNPQWLVGAELNIVDSCFKASGDKPAVISANECAPEPRVTTYGELERLVNRIANGLYEHGFRAGETIALYMPMTLTCVATYLAIIRAGLCVASIADSFSPPEIAKRCEMADAECIVTVDAFERAGRTIRLYEKVRQAGVPKAIVIAKAGESILRREGDLSFFDDLLSSRDDYESVVSDPSEMINVLFSSGTTGTPKAVPWTHLTPIKCAMDGRFHQDICGDDVVAWPTNVGWMMGPWLIFATLLNDATMALFEGVPTGEQFTRFVGDSRVSVLGVVPSLVRAWHSHDAVGEGGWPHVRVFSSTGEPSNRRDSLWLMSQTGYRAPIIEYLGGTEIGGGHLTGTVVQAASPAMFTTPALGIEFVVLDEDGEAVQAGETGELFLIPPSIGLSQALLYRNHEEIYYVDCPPGFDGEVLRRHGDEIVRLHKGYFMAQGRADDAMNLGGIKVSSVELERAIESHPAVEEAAAVGAQIEAEGPEKLVIFAVLQSNAEPEGLRHELQARIADELNPLFQIDELITIDALPRTASNKVLRRQLRSHYIRSGRA
jgi:acetyl-CoA synthetase